MALVSGKILRVNLTTKAVSEESAQEYEERFIGSRGVNSFILFNEVRPETKPFDPENYLIFGAGPLAGSKFPCSAYILIGSKNVFTDGINWAAAGGHFASELRHAGWSNIVISGKSTKSVYLYIKDDYIEFRDASHTWGKDTWETQDIIRQEIGDPKLQFATIGPAGENLVRAACVICGRTRAAASGGLGAIMGSKNLKAIVVRGTQETRIADPERFKTIVEDVLAKFKANPPTEKLRTGTVGAMGKLCNELCIYPTRNTQDDHDDNWALIDYPAYGKTGNRVESCWNCPLECGFGEMETDPKGLYPGVKINPPEVQPTIAFGCRVDVHDPDYILKCFELVSRYGLCSDVTGTVIGWAFECFEKGLLNMDDTDGLDLTWGNGKAVIELIRKIAYREGFGNLLAEGCKRASEVTGKGSIYYCSHLKGQDNLDTPRSLKAWGLGNNTSLRGGRHLDGAPTTEYFDYSPEECERVWGVPTASEATTYEGKGKLVAWHTKYKAAIDSLGVCYFTSQWGDIALLSPEDYAKALSAASGREISGEDFMKIGDRIHNVEKAFNTLHAGFTREDDYPPLVYIREPIKTGKYKGEKVDIEGHDLMLDEFYEAKGWDKKTSWQKEENLAKLEIPEVIERLREARKLL